MLLCSAITFIVVPFLSPVSVNARLAAARIELFLSSAVSRRRTGGASPAGLVAALGTRCPRFLGTGYGECAHTSMLDRCTVGHSRTVARETSSAPGQAAGSHSGQRLPCLALGRYPAPAHELPWRITRQLRRSRPGATSGTSWPATRVATPLTQVYSTPVLRAISRSLPPGWSWTRSTGAAPTVSGSKATRSA